MTYMRNTPRFVRLVLVALFFIVAIGAVGYGYITAKHRNQVFGEVVRLESDFFVISDARIGERTLYIPAGMTIKKGRETVQSLTTGDPVVVVTKPIGDDRLEAIFVRIVEQKPKERSLAP